MYFYNLHCISDIDGTIIRKVSLHMYNIGTLTKVQPGENRPKITKFLPIRPKFYNFVNVILTLNDAIKIIHNESYS